MIGCKTGIDYENKVVSMLLGLGFKAQRVGKNDNGVDIFASKSGIRPGSFIIFAYIILNNFP